MCLTGYGVDMPSVSFDDWEDDEEVTKPGVPAQVRKQSGTFALGTNARFEQEQVRKQSWLNLMHRRRRQKGESRR